jgi:acyl dehydratase
MPTIFHSSAELAACAVRDLGVTDWIVVEQSRIDAFAEATGDHQWIHVDIERAKRSPYGGTIAHGYLVLSLVSLFLPQLLEVRGAVMGINYGCDRLRFPSAVRAGARIRGRGEVLSAEAVAGSGVQVKIRVTVELEGSDKPACVAETLSRWYFE